MFYKNYKGQYYSGLFSNITLISLYTFNIFVYVLLSFNHPKDLAFLRLAMLIDLTLVFLIEIFILVPRIIKNTKPK